MEDIVVGIGEILWDIFPNGKILGGAPANFAYHATQLGLNGYAISAIGNDELGKEILDTLKDKHLHKIIETTEDPTRIVKVELSDDGIPNYEICEGVAWDNIPFTKEMEEIAKKTKAVCFGSLAQRNNLSKQTINKFLDNVPDDALKIFDINLRQNFYTKEIIENSFQKANILKINDEEIIIVAKLLGLEGKSETEVAKIILKQYNLTGVILTKGAFGSYIICDEDALFLSTPKVEVADTVGAGDSFTAGFVASLLKGKSIHEAHKKAVEVSAYICTQHGAMPELPAYLKDI